MRSVLGLGESETVELAGGDAPVKSMRAVKRSAADATLGG